jgi:hypothetical protein
MGKQKLMSLVNLGSWSNYKKKPSYKNTKENKENVSNQGNNDIAMTLWLIPLTGTPYIGHPFRKYKSQYKETAIVSIHKLSVQQKVLFKG